MEKAAKTSTYRKPATDEARQRANEYRRQYRREHPDKARQWRLNYIMRTAARLQAQEDQTGQQNTTGGDTDG